MEDGKKKDDERKAKEFKEMEENGIIIREENPQIKREMVGPEPQDWEKNIWSDVVQDTQGNLLR